MIKRIEELEKYNIKTKLQLLIVITFCIVLAFIVKDLKSKIEDLEKRNTQVHEYILDKIGG